MPIQLLLPNQVKRLFGNTLAVPAECVSAGLIQVERIKSQFPGNRSPMHTATRLLTAAILTALSTSALAAGPAERALGQLRANGAIASAAQGDVFLAKSVKLDADGTAHVRFDRTHKGLRVLGGDLVTHERNGSLKSVSKTLNSVGRPSTTATIKADDATMEAGLGFNGDISSLANNGLVIWAHGKKPVLAYEVSVAGWREEGFGHDLMYVDARSGKIVGTDSVFKTASATGTGRTLLVGNVSMTTDQVSATSFRMVDPSRGGGNTRNGLGKVIDRVYNTAAIMTDTDNIWGNNNESDVASEASDAHYGVAATWDFYKNTYGRNGIYNDGVGVKSIVNVIFQSAGYRGGGNAGWYGGSNRFMAYGSGDATWYPVVSVDVAGHEMTHGVTEAVNGLVYSGESGGLNEAASDIMGAMVEFYANNPADTGDYLIGERIYRSNPDGSKALRSMFRPNKDGKSADCWYSGLGSLNVHYSSGPANHFFYLLAEGTAAKTFSGVSHATTTCKAGDTLAGTGTASLSGIGRDAAAAIWYRAMDVYFTSSTNYAAARTATLNAAADLHGAGSAQYNAVAAAWSAVNVN